jgi:hypothetical protein
MGLLEVDDLNFEDEHSGKYTHGEKVPKKLDENGEQIMKDGKGEYLPALGVDHPHFRVVTIYYPNGTREYFKGYDDDEVILTEKLTKAFKFEPSYAEDNTVEKVKEKLAKAKIDVVRYLNKNGIIAANIYVRKVLKKYKGGTEETGDNLDPNIEYGVQGS